MKNTSIIEKLLGTLLATLVFIYIYWAYGITVCYLWEWFIQPTFALDPITKIQALGIAVTVGVFSRGVKIQTREDNRKLDKSWKAVASIIINPWMGLVVGFLIKQFL